VVLFWVILAAIGLWLWIKASANGRAKGAAARVYKDDRMLRTLQVETYRPGRTPIQIDLPSPRLATTTTGLASKPPADRQDADQGPAAEGRPGIARPVEAADEALMQAFGVALRDGAYHAHGYAFASLGQAVNYARRRQGVAAPPMVVPRPAVPAPPAARPPTGSARWFGAGEAVEVAGARIEDGLLYVGASQRVGTLALEKSLIDPAWPIAVSGSDPAGETLGYWPSYREISQGARRSYLNWLAAGRSAPGAGIGYVFIFFYGLERRLFVDKAFGEADAIVAEVRRLLAIYGENHSFRQYASRLIEAAELFGETEVARPPISPESRYLSYEMPISARRYLGALLAAGTPFEADDALLWLMSLPDTYLRTAGVRCFDELSALWRLRFAQRHPEGLKVRAPQIRVHATYRSASGAFEASLSAGDLPDIASVQAPLAGLRDLLQGCEDALDAYSRLLGRKPEARGELEAALCLPAELRDTPFAAGVEAVRANLDAMIAEERASPVPVRRICELLQLAFDESKLSAGAQRQVATALDRLDIAFEPDRRYGDGALTLEGEMVIYRAAGGAPLDPERADYVAARTMVEIAALAATADGEVVPAEFDSISADLQAMSVLGADDRARLLAYALWLLRDPPRQQAALNRLVKLPLKQRQAITQSAISAVLADGRVLSAEVRFLEKLYKSLGLPQGEVYATLHRGAVQVDEPVVVATESWTAGVPIPPERPAAPQAVAIDEARLARVRLETSQVSTLLAGIFTEEETATAPATLAAGSAPTSRFAGLEAGHAELLAAVVADGAMARAAFEQQAKALRLLPDGAIETINEWAFETFDEPVLEGDDELSTAPHLREQLNAMDLAP
jgi:hypothetical protein